MPQQTKTYNEATNTLTSTGNALAALCSSVTTSALTYPLELARTRMQVQDGTKKYLPQTGTNVGNIIRNIYTKEGFKGLYTGVSLSMMGSAMAWTIYMYAYSHLKDEVVSNGYDLSHFWVGLCSLSGGVLTQCVMNPVWVMKTRMQLQVVEREYRSPLRVFLWFC